MRPTSLRARITAVAVAAVAVVLAVTAISVVLAQRSQLTTTLDTTLRQRADDIAALLDSADLGPVTFGASDRDGFAQLVAGDGAVLAASPNLADRTALPIPAAGSTGDRIATLTDLPLDEDAFRVLTRSIASPDGASTLHVGTAYEAVGESTEALTTTMAISMPLLTLLLGGLIWWLVGRTLLPVEQMRAEVASIGGTELARRVHQPPGQDEVAKLAETMNAMLGRIEVALERQQSFVADASHELRSPIARMRAEVEVDLATAAGGDEARLVSLRDELVGLQALTEDLLYLARSDSEPARPPRMHVDLDDLIFAEAAAIRAASGVTIDVSAISPVQVTGDKSELRRAFRNVMENASRHATSVVSVSLAAEGEMARASISDDGPGVNATEAPRIFERFSRLDESRSRDTGGTGLGLSITRDIVERHDGGIRLDQGFTGGARFVIDLPLANDSA